MSLAPPCEHSLIHLLTHSLKGSLVGVTTAIDHGKQYSDGQWHETLRQAFGQINLDGQHTGESLCVCVHARVHTHIYISTCEFQIGFSIPNGICLLAALCSSASKCRPQASHPGRTPGKQRWEQSLQCSFCISYIPHTSQGPLITL